MTRHMIVTGKDQVELEASLNEMQEANMNFKVGAMSAIPEITTEDHELDGRTTTLHFNLVAHCTYEVLEEEEMD